MSQSDPLVLTESIVACGLGDSAEQFIDLVHHVSIRRRHHRNVEAHHPQEATGSVRAMARPRTPAGRARVTNERLGMEYPGSARELCALRHADAFELLVGMAQDVVVRFGGEVPSRLDQLVTLPGVGRKTANVVRSVAFGLPGLPVDTHVQRLSLRLGLTDQTDPVRVEKVLNRMIPASERGAFSLRLILHGRATCKARSPRCDSCVLSDFCPSEPTEALAGRNAPRSKGVARGAS